MSDLEEYIKGFREPWMAKGICAGVSVVFYPERSNSRVQFAKNICKGKEHAPCPVRADCLEYALVHNEKYGVWGGTSERERRKLQRVRRQRSTAAQAPPKVSAPLLTETIRRGRRINADQEGPTLRRREAS